MINLFADNLQQLNNSESSDLDLISQMSEDDPRLVKIIKNWFIESPPDATAPYAFDQKEPNLNGQVGQANIIDGILNQVSG